jgi:hypothetical protein
MMRLVWLLPLFGCVIPFVHSRSEQPHSPAAVRRFSAKAQALTRAPGEPSLAEVTYSMSAAIEALPGVKDADELELEVAEQAQAMKQRPNQAGAMARASLDAALEALRRAHPVVPQADKDKAVDAASQAIQKVEPDQLATIHLAYNEVARAMVVVTGGRTGAAGDDLSQLVARFAVEEPDDAQRTGAQAIAAMSDALQGRHDVKELRKRADRLATASSLDYALQLKEALSLVIGTFDRSTAPPNQRRLLDQATAAVAAIRDDRPLGLQQARAVDALRLVSEAIINAP